MGDVVDREKVLAVFDECFANREPWSYIRDRIRALPALAPDAGVVVLTGAYQARDGSLRHEPEHHDSYVRLRDDRLAHLDGKRVRVRIEEVEG